MRREMARLMRSPPGSEVRVVVFAQRPEAADENNRAAGSRAHLVSGHLTMRTKIKKEMAGLMVLVCQPRAAVIAERATFFRPSGKSLPRFQPRGQGVRRHAVLCWSSEARYRNFGFRHSVHSNAD